MADVRDLIVSERPRIGVAPALIGLLSKLKLRVRRVVAATAFPPFRYLYAGIYRAHIWYAARTLGAVPGVRSVYVSRGAVSKDVVYGISDIDLIVFGDWTDEQQAHFNKVFQRLIARSPLYDHTAAAQPNTLESLRSLYHSDYFFQFRFDWARTQSLLIHGEDVLSTLPAMPPERVRGGYLMELKILWMTYMTSAFGSGPTSTDRLFRNSIAVKVVAGTLNMQRAFESGALEYSRAEVLKQALPRVQGDDKRVVERMQRCLASRYLRYDGDVQNDSFHFLLRATESIHRGMFGPPPFDPVPDAQLEVDAPAAEMFKDESIDAHVRQLVEHVKRSWAGYRGAFLLPRNSFAGLDELQLLIDVDPLKPPTVSQVRELCALHALAKLRQRIAIYLLLPEGAYLLERQSPLEFWQVLLNATANPETFALLSQREFVVDGAPRPGPLRWTRFAAHHVEHEIALRRSAMGKAKLQGSSTPLFLLRGIWRQLQLEVIQRSFASGHVHFPLTVPAVLRGMRSWGLPDLPILRELQTAYRLELQGQPSSAAEVIPQAIAFFTRFQQNK